MKTPTTPKKFRALIMDDNPIITAVMQEHLKVFFPSIVSSVAHEPTVLPDFDIYFVDNDFEGEHRGISLVRQIRDISPNALVVALSNTLNVEEFSKMMNQGCNLSYDKRNPMNSTAAREVINNYLDLLKEQMIAQSKNKLQRAISSVQHLLSTWNNRLNH